MVGSVVVGLLAPRSRAQLLLLSVGSAGAKAQPGRWQRCATCVSHSLSSELGHSSAADPRRGVTKVTHGACHTDTQQRGMDSQ